MIDKAYSTFIDPSVVPLLNLKDNTYIMEEYYGSTASFKDLALQLFPQMFEYSIRNTDEKYLVLVATSGDTGSAVLDGFRKTNIPVIVLYPYGKVR
jgi:threonine synthase